MWRSAQGPNESWRRRAVKKKAVVWAEKKKSMLTSVSGKMEGKRDHEERKEKKKKERKKERMKWKHFGCDESQHCHWSRAGQEGSRGWKKDKKKVRHLSPTYFSPCLPRQQREYLSWEALCVGTTFQILKINEQLAQMAAQRCCSTNILDHHNKD